MTCKAYKTNFEKYTEGVLDQAAQDDLLQHIKTCSACATAHREFFHMQEILQDSMTPSHAGKQTIAQAITHLEIQPQRQGVVSERVLSVVKYGVAAVAFLVIGLMLGSHRLHNPAPAQPALTITVAQLQGEVLVRHAWETDWRKMTVEESIYEGDAFRSLHQASLVLFLDKDNTVSLNENSSLDLLEYNGQTEFEVTYGTVKATLEGPHEPFFIRTPQGRFEALGTEFIVRVR